MHTVLQNALMIITLLCLWNYFRDKTQTKNNKSCFPENISKLLKLGNTIYYDKTNMPISINTITNVNNCEHRLYHYLSNYCIISSTIEFYYGRINFLNSPILTLTFTSDIINDVLTNHKFIASSPRFSPQHYLNMLQLNQKDYHQYEENITMFIENFLKNSASVRFDDIFIISHWTTNVQKIDI